MQVTHRVGGIVFTDQQCLSLLTKSKPQHSCTFIREEGALTPVVHIKESRASHVDRGAFTVHVVLYIVTFSFFYHRLSLNHRFNGYPVGTVARSEILVVWLVSQSVSELACHFYVRLLLAEVVLVCRYLPLGVHFPHAT